jgi:hypothetical protein
MIGLLKSLLKNDAGFTAIEYGLIGAVSLAGRGPACLSRYSGCYEMTTGTQPSSAASF